jgi:hypothetical protein
VEIAMSASIPRKKGWVIIRFDNRLDAQDGNQPVFRIPAAIPSGPNCFYKTIDAFGGCLYSQPSYISRRPCGTLSNNEIGKAIEIHFVRDEEDKCAV